MNHKTTCIVKLSGLIVVLCTVILLITILPNYNYKKTTYTGDLLFYWGKELGKPFVSVGTGNETVVPVELPDGTLDINCIFAESPLLFWVMLTMNSQFHAGEIIYVFYEYIYNEDTDSYEHQYFMDIGEIEQYPPVLSFVVLDETDQYLLTANTITRFSGSLVGYYNAENMVFVAQCKALSSNIVVAHTVDVNSKPTGTVVLKMEPQHDYPFDMNPFLVEEVWKKEDVFIETVSYSEKVGLIMCEKENMYIVKLF